MRRAVAVAAVGIAAALAARWNEAIPREWRTGLPALAAAAAVYLPSIVIVDVTVRAGRSRPDAAGAAVGLLGGDRRSARSSTASSPTTGALRIGGLALLGIAVAKVFFYDLATLESIYRVLSFIAIGLLLLAGAFAYQRMRAEQR